MKPLLLASLLFTLVLLLETVQKCDGTSHRKRSKEAKSPILNRKLSQLQRLNVKAAKRLADLTDYTRFYNEYLKHILRVRVPGTVGHHEVKGFIISKLKELQWNVKIDDFQGDTPLGPKRFTNIIATLNPGAKKRLTLAAHYDSKLLEPKNGKYFIAATDSAVPCAMLLDIAETVHRMDTPKHRDVGLQLVFFDGEEAFVEWTESDSIYGSRHLANIFETAPHHGNSTPSDTTMLQAMDALVLLDLIGAVDMQFLNLYESTTCLYYAMQKIEENLTENGLVSAHRTYFPGKPPHTISVEDDHVPFLRKNVPILHLISIPFPKGWHSLDDDESILHQPTIENMLKIMRVFAAEYMQVDITQCPVHL